MASPQIDALRQQFDELNSEYHARFAGQSRVTRDVGEIDSLVARSKELSAKLSALPAGDADLVEKMVAAMILEYVVMVNSDPSYDRDEELVERIVRFVG